MNKPETVPVSMIEAKKNALSSSFMKKGVFVAILSGICYGLYSAFLMLGTSHGAWVDWYAVEVTLVATVLLGALGSAINDTISAIWATIISLKQGKLGDFFRCLKTKPGRIMVAAALIGGPISSTAYLVGFKMAGSIVIPITALCPAIGAILGRILFKQQLNARMLAGIFICVFASALIGSTALDISDDAVLGICFGFIAALGWGIEGCVAGYGTSMIDSQIGITIRQWTSGLSNLIILVPLFGILSGGFDISFGKFTEAVTDSAAMPFFIVSGFFALFAYSLWYKGNSMCGAALGMACNGAYSFWGPFFCWIIVGVIWKFDGYALPAIAWVAALLMVIGILIISMNPLDLFRKKEAK